jgi:hypothetical protein
MFITADIKGAINMKKRFINTISVKECPMGGKNCGTCMYCDNRRSFTGFILSPVDSGEHNHCNLLSDKGHINND